jgi:hypothetical protein
LTIRQEEQILEAFEPFDKDMDKGCHVDLEEQCSDELQYSHWGSKSFDENFANDQIAKSSQDNNTTYPEKAETERFDLKQFADLMTLGMP